MGIYHNLIIYKYGLLVNTVIYETFSQFVIFGIDEVFCEFCKIVQIYFC